VTLLYTQHMEDSPTRWWDLPSAGILLAAVFTAAGRLGVTHWAPHLDYVETLTVIGMLLGIVLGQSLFNRRTVAFLALGYSLFSIPLQLSLAVSGDLNINERLASLGGRLAYSLGQFSQHQPVEDWLFFISVLAIIYWTIGLVAGYWLTRHANFLVAILPSGIAIMIVQVYDKSSPLRIWFLAFFIFLALLLLGRLNYLRNNVEWRRRRVFLVPETSMDLINGTLIASAIIVLASWTLPGTLSKIPFVADTWDQVSQPWQGLRDRISDALASIQGTGVVGTEFFGNQLALGTGVSLSDEVVFSVHPQSLSNNPPRYYWRGRVYDDYENNQWKTSSKSIQPFSPKDTNLPIPDAFGRRIVDFAFTLNVRQYTLYDASQPLWVSRPTEVTLSYTPEGYTDVYLFQSRDLLEAGETYQTRAAIGNPTVIQMRGAGTDYPAWVTERYLELPQDFPTRIGNLAQQITQEAETPYDKAEAITQWLRKEIKYSPSIRTPPAEENPIEWFLFDYKEGFCNYYATSEVLMLRSLGIPARMAVGFAQGELNDRDDYIVRHRDYHAWPEVFFPGVGWVEFEPTANQDPLLRPQGREQDPTQSGANGLSLPTQAQRDRELPIPEEQQIPIGPNAAFWLWVQARTIAVWVIPLALILLFWLLNRRFGLSNVVVLALIATLERYDMDAPDWLLRAARMARANPIERAFETINTSLRWLGKPPTYHDTPAERASGLTEIIPGAAPAIQTLVEEHQTSFYSPRPGDVERARHASLVIWKYTAGGLLERAWKTVRQYLPHPV
jgi:transglutaminase-like putative cysteine protease